MTQSQASRRDRRTSTPRAPLARDPHLSLYLLIAACVAADLSFVPLLPGLRASRGLSGTEAALLLSADTVAMIIAPVPLGHLADRLGARRLLTGGGALVTMASVILATGDGFAALLIGRILIGLTNAIIWTPARRSPHVDRGRSPGRSAPGVRADSSGRYSPARSPAKPAPGQCSLRQPCSRWRRRSSFTTPTESQAPQPPQRASSALSPVRCARR